MYKTKLEHAIVYKPHCSECGELLHDEVTYGRHIEGDEPVHMILTGSVRPYFCPRCKTYFEMILVPRVSNPKHFSYDADEIDGSKEVWLC